MRFFHPLACKRKQGKPASDDKIVCFCSNVQTKTDQVREAGCSLLASVGGLKLLETIVFKCCFLFDTVCTKSSNFGEAVFE